MTTTDGCDRDGLWALAVGALEPEDLRRREEHVEGCAGCRARLEAIRADVEALGCHASLGASPELLAQGVLERSRRVQSRARRLRWLALGAVLVGAVASALWVARTLAMNALARRDLWRVEHAIQRLQNAEGRYPADEAALAAALARLADPQLRLDAEGYPLDHWGHRLRYRYPGREVPELFDLWSFGADGEDDDGGPTDLTNWR